MNNRYSFEEVKDSAKLIDAWWTVKVIDPIALRLTYLFANYTGFTPNQITIFSLIFGLVSAIFFLKGDYLNLVLGAITMELSFVFDCVDGKIARLKKTGTQFGAYWDFIQDRLVQFAALFALIWSQYQLTGNTVFWILGMTYVLQMLSTVPPLSIHEGWLRKLRKKRAGFLVRRLKRILRKFWLNMQKPIAPGKSLSNVG
jgi:phosphatidylglycerophosphate synthase